MPSTPSAPPPLPAVPPVLDGAAQRVVAAALEAAGYADVWIQTMNAPSGGSVLLVSTRPVETATFSFGPRVWPRGAGGGPRAES